ncbi:DUF4159 domain-containing protein [Labrys okinawensis]|uniref:DUF4159 domain-containing protein n=1 Tax=Labrys okinawensis TaxID=346911 RepID=UPI0039BC3A58
MFGTLALASPWMLAALVLLPAIWLLLRLIPPRPQRIDFPPLRLLYDLMPRQRVAARSPWWLTALRLLLAACVIAMLAVPILRPSAHTGLPRSGPLLLLVDNGWAAASNWDLRKSVIQATLQTAEQDHRPVALVALAEPVSDLSLSPAAAVAEKLAALNPEPWQANRGVFAKAIGDFLRAEPDAEIAWFSDGLAGADDNAFLKALAPSGEEGKVTVYRDSTHDVLALAGANNAPSGVSVRVLRTGTLEVPLKGSVRALDLKSLPVGQADFIFAPGASETTATLDLPVDIRNDIARIELVGANSAGSVQLLDRNWRRRVVGIVSGQDQDVSQPLLSANYYLGRALQPFADVRAAQGTSPSEAIDRYIDDKLPVLMLADVGNLGPAEDKLSSWIDNGGVLVRFAGSRLAAAENTLLPVKLREGGRTLGGALSWEKPQKLGSFDANGPFAGLAVPEDITINRQLLAEPDIDLPGKTWATLADGTPLVTAEKRGKGLLVLFHVTADTTWSNLVLSGTFPEMLRKVVGLATSGPAADASAAGAPASSTAPVFASPSRTLDGLGAFEVPPATAQPARVDQPGVGRADHPPGFYGPPDGLVAVNALAPNAYLKPLEFAPLNATFEAYAVAKPVALGPAILVFALVLLMADALIVFFMSGGLSRLTRAGTGAAALVLFAMVLALPHEAHAQSRPFDAALRTRLAYVVTGDKETDDTSLAGLKGLTAYITERTALEPGPPDGIDLAKDELAFYPLIYWPIVPGQDPPPPAVMARVDAFMKSGGMVIFDTRDAVQRDAGQADTPAGDTLKRLLAGLDIPELEPVPPKHVLTKTFYLLDKFMGRYDTGETWVQATPQTADDADKPVLDGDGVSPIIITSNDLAGAWAIDDNMNPLFPVSTGLERQRELAYRAGVNMVMYALTGNYKADQVHVQDLLERLGR